MLSPLVACLQPIDSVLASKSTLGILDRLRPTVGAFIQPSLDDAFTAGSSGNLLHWMQDYAPLSRHERGHGMRRQEGVTVMPR